MIRRALALSLLVPFALAAQEPAPAPIGNLLTDEALAVAAQLRETALAGSGAYELVESLTTEVGPRMAGSPGDVRAVDLTVAFHGMFGAQGVLPWHYTEYVVERLSKRDRSLRDFADALQHRSLAFHYRAWRKYRLPFACESAAVEGGVDDVTTALRGLVGVGTDHLRERVVEGCERWIHFAGLFGRAQRTTRGLEAMLEALLGSAAP